VLTSTPHDNYYEQSLLSMTSLKLKMPEANITLLCDTKTRDTLCGKRTEYEKLVAKTITVNTPSNMHQFETSRWLKTSMRRLVDGDFLFLDSDTIITDNLSTIKELRIVFGVCLDKHSLISNHRKKNYIDRNNKILGFNTTSLSNKHFNSGVIYCSDNPDTHRLMERWHELWLFSKTKNIVRDQPAFNQAISENEMVVSELDGRWNCQIAYNGLPFLSSSKIIHYFSMDMVFQSSPFIFASNEVFESIKKTGEIPNNIMSLLNNPRAAFVSNVMIISEVTMLEVIGSDLFQLFFFIHKLTPRLYYVINWCISIGKRIIKFFMKKRSISKNGGISVYD